MNVGKDLGWVPLRIERVAEVTFGQLQEGRFRHGIHVPALAGRIVTRRSCTYDQLEVADPVPFSRIVSFDPSSACRSSSASGAAWGVGGRRVPRPGRTRPDEPTSVPLDERSRSRCPTP